MIRTVRHRCRALSTNAMLGVIIGLIVVSLGIFLLVTRPRQIQEEETKKENIEKFTGKSGHATRKTMLPERVPGINLPVADQAVDGEANPAVTVELPIEFNDKPNAAAAEIERRYDEIRAAVGEEAAEKTVIILKPDRNLQYRVLRRAVGTAPLKGFNKLRVACLKKATTDDVGYLSLDLPGDGKITLLRLVREGPDSILYVLGMKKPRRSPDFEQAASWMKDLASGLGDKTILVIQPDGRLVVQDFIDVLNTAHAEGIKRIGVG